MVPPEVAFEREQVCLIFSSPFSLLSPTRWQRCRGNAIGLERKGTGTPGFEQGKEEEDMKTNAKRLLSRFGSRSIGRTAAF